MPRPHDTSETTYTLDEAKTALKTRGFMVIAQRAFDEIIAEKYAKAYEKARQEAAAKSSADSLENGATLQETPQADLYDSQATSTPDAPVSLTTVSAVLSTSDFELETSSHPPSMNAPTLAISADNAPDSQQLEQLIQENETLKKAQADSISRAEYEQNLQAERDKTLQAQQEADVIKNIRKEDELLKVIRPWAVAPDLVLQMTRDQFALDAHGMLYPIIPQKEASNDETPSNESEALSVDAFYQHFRQNKPYLVKASNSHGAGSLTQSGGTANGISATLEQLAEMSMAQFIKAGGLSGKTRGA
jgi:hypothetical protein